MASVNKVILIGHLGRDPETRYMPSGDAMTTISLATTEQWRDKEGNKQEKTEWHRIVMFGKVAEIAEEYLKKGAQVYFEGALQTRKWTDKGGNDRYSTEVVCRTMKMLSKPTGGSQQRSEPERPPQRQQSGDPIDDLEDDIPF